MPKIVNHDERRNHIVDSVMAIIARDGFDSATMREIAAEAGYAHGAIVRYFPDKQSLLTAAFLRVFRDSHQETLDSVAHLRGLAALRQMSLDLMPFPGRHARSARVVLAFWERAAQDPAMAQIHHENITLRRDLIRRLLDEARQDDELDPDLNIEDVVNRVSAHNAGWQMLGVLVPEAATDASLRASVDAVIASLRPRNQV